MGDSLPFMVLEGTVVPENHEIALKLKSLANQLLDEKPSKWSEETIYHQRYSITDLIDFQLPTSFTVITE